ncbi:MAG: thiamine phosphate synthase [Cocleimonas sp.]|nr:thiamine phosphate synthase [Cocleimonas sp.]
MSILLIGGTDPSGAGLQTDWQVAHHLKVQANSVVTAVTSQNEQGVFDQGIVPHQQLKSQLASLNDVVFSVIKIGMLGNQHTVKTLVEFLKKQPAETIVILDPVLASSSGSKLLTVEGLQVLLAELLPFISLITPNTNELALLTQSSYESYADIEVGAQKLLDLGVDSVLVKGGHFATEQLTDAANAYPMIYSTDFFLSTTEQFYLQGERWKNRVNVRGTGCALASSIACLLDQSYSLNDALVVSKALISGAIRHAVNDSRQYKLLFIPQKTDILFELMDFPKVYKQLDVLNKHYQFESCETLYLGVYPVVDSVEWIEKLIPLGIETIQLRIKDKQDSEVESDIIQAIHYAQAHKVRLFINDYWQLALKHKAYGIHLGQEDLERLSPNDLDTIAESGCRLGLSTHSYSEVARAYTIKPSYLALGPIFETTSKEMPWIPQGVKAVEDWVKFFDYSYPLVAIGGINVERAQALKRTEVGSVAMISAITEAEDYVKATKDFIDVFKDGFKLWKVF